MNQVTLTKRVRDAMLNHLAGVYPFEGCGLLVGYQDEAGLRITRAVPCPNTAPRELQTRRFSIDPRAVLNARRTLRGTSESILGFFHSHPDAPAEPSATDMDYIRLWPETLWVIVPVAGGEPGEPRSWWLDEVDAHATREIVTETVGFRKAVPACPD